MIMGQRLKKQRLIAHGSYTSLASIDKYVREFLSSNSLTICTNQMDKTIIVPHHF